MATGAIAPALGGGPESILPGKGTADTSLLAEAAALDHLLSAGRIGQEFAGLGHVYAQQLGLRRVVQEKRNILSSALGESVIWRSMSSSEIPFWGCFPKAFYPYYNGAPFGSDCAFFQQNSWLFQVQPSPAQCEMRVPVSGHTGGMVCGLGDGSVRFVAASIGNHHTGGATFYWAGSPNYPPLAGPTYTGPVPSNW